MLCGPCLSQEGGPSRAGAEWKGSNSGTGWGQEWKESDGVGIRGCKEGGMEGRSWSSTPYPRLEVRVIATATASP